MTQNFSWPKCLFLPPLTSHPFILSFPAADQKQHAFTRVFTCLLFRFVACTHCVCAHLQSPESARFPVSMDNPLNSTTPNTHRHHKKKLSVDLIQPLWHTRHIIACNWRVCVLFLFFFNVHVMYLRTVNTQIKTGCMGKWASSLTIHYSQESF